MHYIKKNNIKMNLLIKFFKKNIYINLLIILFFLSFFFYNDYGNIKRYLDGYKYTKSNKILTSYFYLIPKEKFLYTPTQILFEKTVKKYFDETYYELKTSGGIHGDETAYTFNYSITFDEEKKIDLIKEKVKQFNILFLKLHSDKMSEIFELDKRFLFGNSSEIIKILDLSVQDVYSLKIKEVVLREELKLGQTKKILLSKMLIGNFFISLFLSILICLIISLLKDDINQSRK